MHAALTHATAGEGPTAREARSLGVAHFPHLLAVCSGQSPPASSGYFLCLGSGPIRNNNSTGIGRYAGGS